MSALTELFIFIYYKMLATDLNSALNQLLFRIKSLLDKPVSFRDKYRKAFFKKSEKLKLSNRSRNKATVRETLLWRNCTWLTTPWNCVYAALRVTRMICHLSTLVTMNQRCSWRLTCTFMICCCWNDVVLHIHCQNKTQASTPFPFLHYMNVTLYFLHRCQT